MASMNPNDTTTHVTLRDATQADRSFAYEVKKIALGRCVEQVWGWDEDTQAELHRKEFDPSRLNIVTMGGQDIGTMQVVANPKSLLINKMYLLPEFQHRLRAKPGITGLAQVELGYTNTVEGLEQKLGFDLKYIRNLTPLADLRILYKTVSVVITGKGAF